MARQIDQTVILAGVMGNLVRVTGGPILLDSGIVGVLEEDAAGRYVVFDDDNDPKHAQMGIRFVIENVDLLNHNEYQPEIVLK